MSIIHRVIFFASLLFSQTLVAQAFPVYRKSKTITLFSQRDNKKSSPGILTSLGTAFLTGAATALKLGSYIEPSESSLLEVVREGVQDLPINLEEDQEVIQPENQQEEIEGLNMADKADGSILLLIGVGFSSIMTIPLLITLLDLPKRGLATLSYSITKGGNKICEGKEEVSFSQHINLVDWRHIQKLCQIDEGGGDYFIDVSDAAGKMLLKGKKLGLTTL